MTACDWSITCYHIVVVIIQNYNCQCNKLSVKSIAELTHDCNCETIEDLISRRQILAQEIATLTEVHIVEPLRSSLYTLTNES